MEVSEGNSSDKSFCIERVSESVLPNEPLCYLKLSSLMRLQMLELGNMLLFPWKVLRTESRDAILLRGEGCNTRGVCHQLNRGFELKHARLSDDEDVKVKPMEASPNPNLDAAPLLYI
jgi:hypothetical protein